MTQEKCNDEDTKEKIISNVRIALEIIKTKSKDENKNEWYN